MRRNPLRRALAVAVIGIWALLAVGGGAATPAGAQEPTSTTALPPAPDIIPRPNQGVAPTDAGDRGGSLQSAVFVMILVSIGVMVVIVVRQSKRARDGRGF